MNKPSDTPRTDWLYDHTHMTKEQFAKVSQLERELNEANLKLAMKDATIEQRTAEANLAVAVAKSQLSPGTCDMKQPATSRITDSANPGWLRRLVRRLAIVWQIRLLGAICRMNGKLREKMTTKTGALWWNRNSGRLLALDEKWFGHNKNAKSPNAKAET